MARFRGQVDETGQPVTINVPRRRRRKQGWRDHVALVDMGLMSRLELSGNEWRILTCIMSCIPEKGGADAFVTMQEIAALTGISVPSISRTMKVMRERNIVMKTTRHTGRWHVNAWLAYNGDFESWNSQAEVDPEPIWRRDGADPKTGEVS